MSKVSKIREKETIDLSGYVDLDTGDVIPDGTIIVREREGNTVSISSENYAVIDADVVEYLSSVLGKADLGRLLQMSTMTATPFNVLVHKNKKPHSSTSLQQVLAIKSKSGFFGFIKNLMSYGILYSIRGKFGNKVRLIYLLNPFMSRRRKTFDSDILSIFDRNFKKAIKNEEE